ncbi:MAG: hypothetical protein CMH83_16125 [Nocardioides sp.]|nr:hypothetical protein [Nocardioides sp.]
MQPVTESEIRTSFVNCTRGESRRAHLPDDLDAQRWDDLDFLGWVDPRAPQTAYLVVPRDAGLTGVRLRRNTASGRNARMCGLCATTHSGQGATLMVANRADQRGRDGNSVGLDLCADLRCSLRARDLVPASASAPVRETLPVEGRVARLHRNLDAFVARVLSP